MTAKTGLVLSHFLLALSFAIIVISTPSATATAAATFLAVTADPAKDTVPMTVTDDPKIANSIATRSEGEGEYEDESTEESPNTREAVAVAVAAASSANEIEYKSESENDPAIVIPLSFDAPFGSYPNLLKITKDERESFSPVVFFPERLDIAGGSNSNSENNGNKITIPVKDHRNSSGELASLEDIARLRTHKKKKNQQQQIILSPRIFSVLAQSLAEKIKATGWFGSKGTCLPNEDDASPSTPTPTTWGIGKYDENRDGGMYESDLFDDLENTIDGYGGRRTVHLGMDLGGPVGTPVHAFCDGVVHSVGYNPDLGDYGHVIVVEHFWGELNEYEKENETTTMASNSNNNSRSSNHPKRCWALYGHLDESTLTTTTTTKAVNDNDSDNDNASNKNTPWRKLLPNQRSTRTKISTTNTSTTTTFVKPGDCVRKGQILGNMGDIDENGGWIKPHLHFQLSTKPPVQPHDMPGASSVHDRTEALQQYPDPRYVLGPMY